MRWLYDFDMETFRAIHIGLHREWLDPLFWLITSSALGWVQTLLAMSLLFWRKARAYVLPLLLADLISGFVIADGIKQLIHRDRPSNLGFAVPQELIYTHSFPSGHTSTAFGVAWMVWFLTRRTERAWMGHAALGWALLVGVSRVYRGVHWPTDVIASIFVGLLGASLVLVCLRASGFMDRNFNVAQPEGADLEPS